MGTAGGAPCPVITTSGGESWGAEVRAYKLGKKRWSYNQIELALGVAGGDRQAGVAKTTYHANCQFPEAHQNSAVCFKLLLQSGHRLQAKLYLVHEDAAEGSGDAACNAAPAGHAAVSSSSSGGDSSGCAEMEAEAAAAESQAGPEGGSGRHCWYLVTRAHCCKGCQGCILRPIKRLGRVGKRSRADEGDAAAVAAADANAAAAAAGVPVPSLGHGPAAEAEGAAGASDAGAAPDCPTSQPDPAAGMKDRKYMYVSIDEACTHVGAAAFRLVAGIYDGSGDRLLATSVSPPIRVLANNDVPTGAARITLEAQLPSDWEGWTSAVEPEAEEVAPARPRAPRRKTAKQQAPTPTPAQPSVAAKPSGSAGGSLQQEGVGAGTEAGLATAGMEQWDSCPLGLLDPPTPAAPASCLHQPGQRNSLAHVPPGHSVYLPMPFASRPAVSSEQVVTTPAQPAKRAALATGRVSGACARSAVLLTSAAAASAAHAPLSRWQRQPEAVPAAAPPSGGMLDALSPTATSHGGLPLTSVTAGGHNWQAAEAVVAWTAQMSQQQQQQAQRFEQQQQQWWDTPPLPSPDGRDASAGGAFPVTPAGLVGAGRGAQALGPTAMHSVNASSAALGAGSAAHAARRMQPPLLAWGASPHQSARRPFGAAAGPVSGGVPAASCLARAADAEAEAARVPLREESQLQAARSNLPHASRGPHWTNPAPTYALHAAAGVEGTAGSDAPLTTSGGRGAPSPSSLEYLCRLPEQPCLDVVRAHPAVTPDVGTHFGLDGSRSSHFHLAGSTSTRMCLAGSTSTHQFPRDDSYASMFDGNASIFADVPDAPVDF